MADEVIKEGITSPAASTELNQELTPSHMVKAADRITRSLGSFVEFLPMGTPRNLVRDPRSKDTRNSLWLEGLPELPNLLKRDTTPTPGRIKEYYGIEKELGSGEFGKLHVCRHKISGEVAAVKSISCDVLRHRGMYDMLQHELLISGELEHDNVVKMWEIFEEDNTMYIVMEYLRGLSLFDATLKHAQSRLVNERKGLALKRVGKYLWQMVSGISYLHFHRIIHRDIKAENFVLSDNTATGALKLIDFGFACHKTEHGKSLTERVGSPYYVAPEVLSGEYDGKCDIYSLGVVGYFICLCDFPYNAETIEDILKLASKGNFFIDPSAWEGIPAPVLDLIVEMLDLVPEKRPNAGEIIKKKDEWLTVTGWKEGEGDKTPCVPYCHVS